LIQRAKIVTIVVIAAAGAEPEVREGLLRTLGNEGLFGYTVGFRNCKLGHFKAYATDWSHAVSIISKTNDFRIVVTPEDMTLFMKAVNEQTTAEGSCN
jgi:hypothetical protein